MSSEHDDRQSDSSNHELNPQGESAARGNVEHTSGPRISVHPMLSDDLVDDSEGDTASRPSQLPGRRSGPPPKPRLKDSKYPTPAASDTHDSVPPPRGKVISSPDLPPARPRSDPQLEPIADGAASEPPFIPPSPRPFSETSHISSDTRAASQAESGLTSEKPSRLPATPSPPLKPRSESAINDSGASLSRPPTIPPAPSGPAETNANAPSTGSLDPDDDSDLSTPLVPPASRQSKAPLIVPPAAPAPGNAALASSPSAPQTNASKGLLRPPPKPVRREAGPTNVTAGDLPAVPPPPSKSIPGAPLRPAAAAAPSKSDPKSQLPKPPALPTKADTSQGVAAPPPPPKPGPSSQENAPSGPLRSSRPSPRPPLKDAAQPSEDRHILPPPPTTPSKAQGTASYPPSGAAATSYPPPGSEAARTAAKLDPIAVHAIRVINSAADDPTLALGIAEPVEEPTAALDDLEELEDYEEEALAEELAPTQDEADLPIDLDQSELEQLPSVGLKPPPPPKRSVTAPAPPKKKKKEPQVPRRKRRPWWEELFGEDFARATHHLKDRHIKREVDFIDHSLGVTEGAVVLDLACGMGQHSVELATRGYSVVGYDLSVYQLAIAGEAAQERGLKINFLQGDMREMAFQEMFDGIFCWNTSFGYFEEEKNVAVAERIFQALRPGGMFLIDVVNRDYVMQNQPSQVWFQGDSCVCMDDMSVDYITSRLRVKRSIIMDDGRTRECYYSIRLYTLHELGKLLHGVGFRVIEASGHPTTPGVYLGPNSPRVIILAQRP